MRISLIIISFMLLSGCCNEPTFLDNGLTKSATKVTQIALNNNSNESDIKLDSFSKTVTLYNIIDKPINRKQKLYFNDAIVETQYEYSKANRINREVVIIRNDTMIMKYFYLDTILSKAIVDREDSISIFKNEIQYEYRSDNTLNQTTSKQLYIDLRSGDTTMNSITNELFDVKEQIMESEITYPNDSRRNEKTQYEYKCGFLDKVLRFNFADSLVEVNKFEYRFDKYKNWIERKSFSNKLLERIDKREIIYK